MFALPRFVKYSALALLLSSSALALPAHAVVNNAAPVPAASGKHHNKTHAGRHEHREFSMRDRVEARIRDLHEAINVTPEQESDWKDVANAMRESEDGVGELIKARRSNRDNSNAIDDIKSYQQISQAHADGMAKFVDAFEPFYAELSPEQKDKADAFFHNFQKRGGGGSGGIHKARSTEGVNQGAAPAVKVK